MTGPAEDFAAAASGVESAETVRQGAFLHQYHAELTAQRGTVRILTLAPERGDEAVEQAFRQVAGQWHNPSSHPTIVTVHERGSEPRPWIATALPAGQPLDADQAELSILNARTVIDSTAEAIRNANLYNSMHLALEPRAVYLDTAGEEPTVQVDDWGLERTCRVAAGETPVSPFTAPELIDDPDGGTERTDVYGLGTVAYYALTGQPPITSATDLATVIQEGDITPPSEHRPELPEAVDQVLLTALSTRPADRQDSAFSFRTGIIQALPSDPPSEPVPDDETSTEDETAENPVKKTETPAESEPSDSQDESVPARRNDDESDRSLTRRVALGGLVSGVVGIGAGGWYLTQSRSNTAGSEENEPSGLSEVPAPEAQLVVTPEDPTIGEEVTLSAAESTGGDGVSLDTYEWVVGADASFAAGEETQTRTFSDTGQRTIRVRVTDSRGRTARATTTLYVRPQQIPMFQYNAANTGHVPGEAGSTDSITERWSYTTGASVESSPAMVDGTVYIGSADGTVHALDATNGTEQWAFDTGGGVRSSPAVVDGTVYVGSLDNSIYALDAVDGTEQWIFNTANKVFSSPAVVDGTVYVGSRDHTVYALSAADGSEQWAFQTDDWVDSSPAVVDGTVYVGSDDGTVYALSATGGTEQWVFETGVGVNSSPAVVDGTVYVGSDDGTVHTLDATNGTEQWAFETGDSVYSSPAVVDGTVYVGSHDNHVYALDATDGTEQWAFDAKAWVYSSPAVVGGTVYVGSAKYAQGNVPLRPEIFNVYALDAVDGTEQWTYENVAQVFSSPAVVDGTVYVGSNDHNVYALTEQ